MGWNEAVITNDGIKLLADCIMGSGIVITSAFGGEGYTDPIALLAQKAIFEPRHKLNIAYALTKEDGVIVNIRIQNNDIDSAYTLKQIGLFAKMNVSNEEILFAIIQDKGGEAIPSQEENPEYLAEFDFFIPVSNVENINVNITSGTFATVEDIANLNEKKVDKEEGKGLSSNDYTDAEKNKLSGITAGATKNTASTTTPKAPGTASAGTESAYARGDHVHPAQTDITGNAGTATKLATARNINGMLFDGNANRINYATCSTAAATAAKTVACAGFELLTGAEITVFFTTTNTAANPTLNVNNTGAKPIYYRGAAIAAEYLAANRIYTFRYTGSAYSLVGDINTNTTYANMTAATASAAGKAGLVPAPAAGAQAKYLRGDGTWQTPPDTNTTYSPATTTAAGLMSAADKTKLDGLNAAKAVTTAGANLNNYTTPGLYYFSADYTPSNIPAGVNGLLEVKPMKTNFVKQIWYRHGTVNSNDYETYIRSGVEGTWSTWQKYAMVNDLGIVCYQGSSNNSVTKSLPTGKTNCLIIASHAKSDGLDCGSYILTGLSSNMTAVPNANVLFSSGGFVMLYTITSTGTLTIYANGSSILFNYTMLYF